jgi:hypothetical protein
MTEAYWDICTDPARMLDWLRERGRLSDRKARLFAVACCRRIWHLLTDERSQRAVEVAELFADGLISEQALHAAWVPTWEAARVAHESAMEREMTAEYAGWDKECAARASGEVLAGDPDRSAEATIDAILNGPGRNGQGHEHTRVAGGEQQHQCGLLRDILGPLPFRLVGVPASGRAWSDGTVVRLAEAAYEKWELPSGHLDGRRLAVLADALEEAGGDAELVAHLRGPGPHVRGCWVVDLLLNKA